MAYTPTAPNRLAVVEQAARDFPTEFREAHRPGLPVPKREAFVKIVASRLHSSDTRFGLNGKRGTTELSQDAIAFIAPGSPAGGVEIIDIIGAAGGDNATPQWSDVTEATATAGTVGKWIQPSPIATVAPPPPSPTPTGQPGSFDQDWYRRTFSELEQIYRDELLRSPIVTGADGQPQLDTEGLAFFTRQMREEGWQATQIREFIRQSEEWKNKHPNG